MPSFSRLAIVIASLFFAAHAIADDKPADSPTKKDKKQPPVAKSHDELGQLLSVAIDAEDYESVVHLMGPTSLLKDLGAPEKSQMAYAEYLSGIPKLAKRYRDYLNEKEMLPLKGKKFQKYNDDDSLKRQVNGKTIQRSTGVRFVDEEGQITFELIDQAIAIDGRWYVTRLCTEDVEKQLKKAER